MEVLSEPIAGPSGRCAEPRRPRRSPATCWWSARARPACRRRATSPGPAPMSSLPTSGCMPAASSSSRWRPRRSSSASSSTASSATVLALHEAALQAGVHILNETTVWAAFSPTEVAAIVAGRSTLFRPKRLVLATGAYEQSLPVPGWTLPGVMTVGALQTLARSYRVAPGERIVIAGNGPLVPADRGRAARRRRQRRGGARSRRRARPSANLPEFLQAGWAAPTLLASGLALVSRLKPLLHWRRRVTRLLGDDRVRRVEAADLVDRCRHRGAGLRLLLVERARALAGLRASLRAARQRLDGDGDRRRRPHQRARGLRDRRRRALRRCPGGDGGGRDRGRCRRPRPRPGGSASRGARAGSLARAERFQKALWRLFEAAPLQAGAIDADALVCRCEEVDAGAMRASGERRSQHAGRAEARDAGRHGPLPGPLLRAVDGPHLLGRARRVRSSSRRGRRPSRCRSARSPSSSPNGLGHVDFVPPDMARPRETEMLPRETVDTLVIGGGVAGSCVAYWLAHEGIDTMVVERDDMNLQASGANAGSLHVQLLAFDFVAGAPPAGNRAADTLPLGPASMRLVAGDRARHRRGSRDQGHRRADAGRERARHRVPQGQDRAGEKPRHRGRADRRQRAAPDGAVRSARRRSPPNGARARARSIPCAAPMR